MSDVVDINAFRQRRGLRVERQGADRLRENFGLPPKLPPVPNAGFHCGDFIRLSTGERAWIREQRVVDGKLLLCVSAAGRVVLVMARDVTPDGAA